MMANTKLCLPWNNPFQGLLHLGQHSQEILPEYFQAHILISWRVKQARVLY